LRFIRVLQRIEVSLEGVEVTVPQLAVGFEPGIEGFERACLEVVNALLSRDAAGDETRLAQDLKVFGDAGLSDTQAVDEVADAAVGMTELVEDGAAGGLGEGGKRINHGT
jgi:hypothetical protein